MSSLAQGAAAASEGGALQPRSSAALPRAGPSRGTWLASDKSILPSEALTSCDLADFASEISYSTFDSLHPRINDS